MTKNEPKISRASEADLEGIVTLQAANQPDHGGTLSGSIPRSKIAEIMREMPLIVSHRGNSVTGFLITGTRKMYTGVPRKNRSVLKLLTFWHRHATFSSMMKTLMKLSNFRLGNC